MTGKTNKLSEMTHDELMAKLPDAAMLKSLSNHIIDYYKNKISEEDFKSRLKEESIPESTAKIVSAFINKKKNSQETEGIK